MTSDFILLVYGRNFPYPYDVQTPLSLFSLGAFLEEHGFTVEYYDERIEPWSRFDALLARRPLAVGFSVMGGFQIASSLELSRRVRKLSPRSRVVWGGFFPSSLPREVMDGSGADFLASGEAEETMLDLARALVTGAADFSAIPGLVWRDAGHPVVNGRRPPPDLERLPFPYHSGALPLLRRYMGKRAVRETVGYETSRGCPFSCGFCYSPAFHGRVRVKSPAKIRRELSALRDLDVSRLDIYDDVLMGGDPPDIRALADMLSSCSFAWSANMRVDTVSPGLLLHLETAGCKWLYFGLESDDDRTLKTLEKGFDSGQLHSGLALLRGCRIGTVFSVIAGLPLEDAQAGAGRALDLAGDIHRLHPDAEIQIQSFVPLPGSSLYPEALRRGWLAPRNLQGWIGHNHFNVRLPWLKNPRLPGRLYLSSFLAWRYHRHLARFPAGLVFWPFHILSLLRIRRRCFILYFEELFYAAAMRGLHLWGALYFRLRNALRPPGS